MEQKLSAPLCQTVKKRKQMWFVDTAIWENRQQLVCLVNFMDETHQLLETLALAAKQYPPDTKEIAKRRIAVTRLISAIQKSGKLYCRVRYEFPPELYEEALQKTWLYLWRNIHNYDPAKSQVMTWVNYSLNKNFLDEIERYNKNRQQVSLDAAMQGKDGEAKTNLLDQLEQPESETAHSDWEAVRQYIDDDPEGVFANRHLRNHPQANFRAISLLLFEGKSWQQVAADLGVDKWPTVQSFYWRCCNNYFAENLRNHLGE